MEEALKKSPVAIGPELTEKNVQVWLDGKKQKITQFNMIPESSSMDMWQVQYLIQIAPQKGLTRGSWHEIEVEVESEEILKGKKIIDFGQGSVGLYVR